MPWLNANGRREASVNISDVNMNNELNLGFSFIQKANSLKQTLPARFHKILLTCSHLFLTAVFTFQVSIHLPDLLAQGCVHLSFLQIVQYLHKGCNSSPPI